MKQELKILEVKEEIALIIMITVWYIKKINNKIIVKLTVKKELRKNKRKRSFRTINITKNLEVIQSYTHPILAIYFYLL